MLRFQSRPALLGLLLTVTLALTGCASGPSAVEPLCQTSEVAPSGDLEIRTYQPMTVAEIEVVGTREQALREGYRLLSDYVDGNNAARSSLDIGPPVVMQQAIKTAPSSAPTSVKEVADFWDVRFLMPYGSQSMNPPAPGNARIKIKQIQGGRYAVLTYSGRWTDENVSENIDRMMAFIRAKRLHTVGEPIMTFYNPPWTVPSARRNEILLALTEE